MASKQIATFNVHISKSLQAAISKLHPSVLSILADDIKTAIANRVEILKNA